uniref:Uncharacterized protein K02A2.6-like n=1 Tax=Saccoglossus kowalevskii TaxID=10224 RepID=A0ABM0MM83_SACKO|nr:PREDICTED: uncharacterized protein K02A2.6-like [Saccoglossus kowalevskii]
MDVYWQIPDDESSQLLTVFNTPLGRYCYLRMPFGINSAQEVFQKRISQHFENLLSVETDIDDILVWGTTTANHDERLKATLKQCEERNLCFCHKNWVHRKYSHPRRSTTRSRRIRAITEIPPATNKQGIMRLLGTMSRNNNQNNVGNKLKHLSARSKEHFINSNIPALLVVNNAVPKIPDIIPHCLY